MKPRTKKQLEIVSLSSELPEVTDEQKSWAHKKLLPAYYVRHRKTTYCLECGHSFKQDHGLVQALTGVDCPSCKHTLKEVKNYRSGVSRSDYWCILDRAGQYQVVRMVITYKHMKKGQKPRYFTDEVMQHFIDADGKLAVSLQKKTSMGHGYVDNWIHTTDLEPRAKSSAHHFRMFLAVELIYPKMRVLPIFRRNGFRTSFHGIAPVKFFNQLVNQTRFETLLKARQYDLLKAIDSHDRHRYWPQIRICIRNGYKVTKPSDWFDYLDLLRHFGKDLNNPHYICPADLKTEHDRYVEKRRRQQKAEALAAQQLKLAHEEPVYEQQKSRYFGICITAGDLVIEPLKSVAEFIEAGDALKHCLYANNYHLKKQSLILAARKDGQYIETIEFDLKDLKVVQSRGLQNRATDHNTQIVEAVNAHRHLIAGLRPKTKKHKTAA